MTKKLHSTLYTIFIMASLVAFIIFGKTKPRTYPVNLTMEQWEIVLSDSFPGREWIEKQIEEQK